LQSEISVLDFQDAEPDILAHSSSEILERFNQFCDDEIKALCKKKGLYGEVIQFFPHSNRHAKICQVNQFYHIKGNKII